jgi:O-antigen ligase
VPPHCAPSKVIALRRGLLAAFVVGLGSSSTLARAALWLLTLRWLWRLRDGEVRRGQRWPLWEPVLAFVGATILSALASNHAAASLVAARTLLVLGALYVTVDALEDAHEGDGFVSWLALAAGAAALVGLVQYSACPPHEPAAGLRRWFFHRCHRARAFYSIYMTLAGVLTIALLVTLPRVLPGGFRAWSAAVWLLTLAGLAVTYTRGAWLGLAAGATTLLPMVSRRGRFGLLAGLVLLPLIFALGPRDLSHRFRSAFDFDEAGIKERVYMWRSGVAMWRERPLLGWGPGGVKREYSRFARPEAFKRRTGHVHNTPLQILVERGAVGLVAWLAIWIAFYWRSIRLFRGLEASRACERALVAGSIAAVTGYLVAGLSEHNFGSSVVVMMAFAVVGLPWAVERSVNRHASSAASRSSVAPSQS